jgi:hypothetical protein
MMRGWLLRGAAGIVAIVAIAYLVDSLVFWRRLSANRAAAFGSVQVYLTTPTKGSRLEIFTDQPQTVTCAHALFPHEGASPCWYASRHTTVQVN